MKVLGFLLPNGSHNYSIFLLLCPLDLSEFDYVGQINQFFSRRFWVSSFGAVMIAILLLGFG